MTDSTSSIRYQRLLLVLDKALSTSKSQFDVDKAVKECYGDDASIFQGDDDANPNNMLQQVLDDLLTNVQEQVATDMREHLSKQGVEEKLLKLEHIIQKLEERDEEQRQAEQADKQSARQALEQVRLPTGMSPTDLVNFAAYQKMVTERDALQKEIEEAETELEGLVEKRQEQSEHMKSRLVGIQQAGKELEKSADICSMVA